MKKPIIDLIVVEPSRIRDPSDPTYLVESIDYRKPIIAALETENEVMIKKKQRQKSRPRE